MKQLKLIKLKIHRDTIERAEAFCDTQGTYRGSVFGGQRLLQGTIGELLVHERFGGELVRNYDYDLLCRGYRIDVKSKLLRGSYLPQPEWKFDIFRKTALGASDLFFVVYVHESFDFAYLAGFIAKEKLLRKSLLVKKGEVITSGGYVAKDDSLFFRLQDLEQFRE